MRSIFKLLIVICVQIIFVFTLNSQAVIRFENYDVSDGLPHNVVNAVYQDMYDWIWIGTNSGLCRFDGHDFKTYFVGNDSSQKQSVDFNCFYETPDSNLWIGTDNFGLMLYDRDLDSFTDYYYSDSCKNCIGSNKILSITSDSSGIIWLGTKNGLNKFNYKTNYFELIRNIPEVVASIASSHVRNVFVDSDNLLWIGTGQGLNYYNLNSNVIYLYNLNRADKLISSTRKHKIVELFEDSKGRILVGTERSGMYVIDKVKDSVFNIIPGDDILSSGIVRTVYEDNNGYFWLGTNMGVYNLDSEFKTVFHFFNKENNRNSLGHNFVNDISGNSSGDLWLANQNGVSYSNLNVKVYNYFGDNLKRGYKLNSPDVITITESNDKEIWFGTESGGINILDKKSGEFSSLMKKKGYRNSLADNDVKSIIQDRQGNFWIGFFNNGLDYYDIKKDLFTHYKYDPDDDNSISSNKIYDLHEDSQDRIWIGSAGGLDRFIPNQNRFQHFKQGFKDHPVHTIIEDKSGNLMFGTSKIGITVLTSEMEIKSFDIPARIIMEDSQGRIWIASDRYFGIKQFDILQGVIKTYTKNDGLASNRIFSIVEDEYSKLWISTAEGISEFDPETEKFKNFNLKDGEFNYNSCCRSSDGELFFGSQNGVIHFYPDSLKDNVILSPVVITDFEIFNKSVPVGKKIYGKVILDKVIEQTKRIVLSYKHNVLTFKYVLLNYNNSQRNEYAYKMEGFDDDWNYVMHKREVTYSNLEPGKYVFKVKASNNYGIWNEAGTSIDIIIKAPFWMALWFRIFVVVLISIIFYILWSYIKKVEGIKEELIEESEKAKKLDQIDKMKFQFLTDISHQIRTPVSLIISPISRIISDDKIEGQLKKDLELVHKNANLLERTVDQLLDYRKIEAGKLELELSRGNIVLFIEKILNRFKDLSDDKRIVFEFYSVLDSIQTYFDSNKIEKIIANILSNSLNHTSAGGKISVALSLTVQVDQHSLTNEAVESREYVQILIKDTTIGTEGTGKWKILNKFYQSKPSSDKFNYESDIDLSLSREFIRIHNGNIKVKTDDSEGAEIVILLPLVKDEPLEVNVLADVQKGGLVETNKEPDITDSQENLIDCETPIILIVEDNKELLEFIESIFVEEYKVITAMDGQIGRALAIETIPDLIISDIMMPNMDGKQMCKLIKSDFKTSHIPVILLTALSSIQHEKDGIFVGADEYISKPFDPSLLKIKVDQLLATRKMLREKFSRENILQPNSNIEDSQDDQFLRQIVEVIESNISDPEFGTIRISQEVGVSRTQLYRKMAALTEMTVKEFIRNYRLKKASQLIISDNLNITQAAFNVGFQQVAYFRKCFKEMFGMTPTDFAKKNKVQNAENIDPDEDDE